jgi:hypothetical protein
MIITQNLSAQNLVPNYSFEVYDTCPSSIVDNQISHAIPWSGVSSDYYNICASITYPPYGVPNSSVGFQHAHTGNAYAGITPFANNGFTNCKEYIQVPLIDSLQMNNCYIAKFYINFVNNSYFSTNNIAINFSDSSYSNPDFLFINLPSHVYKFGNPIITDTLNWIEVKGMYISTGGEKYMTIGNFKSDADTDTLNWNTSATFGASYYLIDDVSLIPVSSIPGGMPAFAGNDTSIASGDSVFMGQEISNLYCNWYAGSTLIADSVSGLYVSPANTTTYIVEQNLCGTITYDTVTVFVSGVGMDETDKSKSVKLFPNPSTEEFTIQTFGFANDAVINITDLSGRNVYDHDLLLSNGSANFKLDISNGVYFVHITNSNNHETIIKKLVIQK